MSHSTQYAATPCTTPRPKTITTPNSPHPSRVASAGVAFSRGRHYWQFRVDSYDANADVAFGVVAKDANRDVMLGTSQALHRLLSSTIVIINCML